VLATATDLWALRYPETHELYMLARPPGGTAAVKGGGEVGGGLEATSGRIHARSAHLARQPAAIIASERMDDDPGWRLLDPGELLHVHSGLTVDSSAPFPPAPRHLVRLSELDPAAAASQHPRGRARRVARGRCRPGSPGGRAGLVAPRPCRPGNPTGPGDGLASSKS